MSSKTDFSIKNKNRLLLFFTLVFVISWGAIYILAGPSGFPINEDQAMIMGIAILLGPTLASIIVTALSGRSGFQSLFSHLFKWRVSLRWYATALLIAPLSTAVTVGFLSLFTSEFQPNILMSSDKIGLLISAIFAGLIVGIFEELGWTGFAVPRLFKNHSILGTGAIVGIIWGAWHFPLFWEANSFTTSLPLILLLARLLSWLPPYRILMVWIYKNTESLFVTIVMHASLVATLMVLDPVNNGANLVIFILARAILLWTIASVMIVRGRKNA
ncbi:MAG: type II CAAX endopeptidase family protein [candidate division KSB1 bacterium]|jgi:membrane protease YdiL (CAAX protease family)|nr:type II CAAX endopeptidase family protein [candidate division KSB1 bacterium]